MQEAESALTRAAAESRREIFTEIKKVLNTSGKFLVGQFDKVVNKIIELENVKLEGWTR